MGPKHGGREFAISKSIDRDIEALPGLVEQFYQGLLGTAAGAETGFDWGRRQPGRRAKKQQNQQQAENTPPLSPGPQTTSKSPIFINSHLFSSSIYSLPTVFSTTLFTTAVGNQQNTFIFHTIAIPQKATH
jgi:hypothetical protein